MPFGHKIHISESRNYDRQEGRIRCLMRNPGKGDVRITLTYRL